MFNLFLDHQQGAAFVICVLTIPLCTFLTILRFVNSKKSRRKVGFEDIFALTALFFFLAYTALFLSVLALLNGRSMVETARVARSNYINLIKVGWIMSAQYAGNQLFAKLSLIFLYHRLFSVNTTFLYWLYVLGSVQTAWGIALYLAKIFRCTPFEKIWNPTVAGRCVDSGPFLAATEAVNSLIDFIMIGLAIWIVRSLQLDKSSKWKLYFLFTIGGLSGIVGFVKIGEAYTAAYTNILDPLWDTVQMATSMICCCAPIYKSVFPSLGLIEAVKEKFGSFSLSRTQLNPKDPGGLSGSSLSGSSSRKTWNPNWLRLNGAGPEEHAWANVSAAPQDRPLNKANSSGDNGDVSYPLRTLEVRQTVEYI